MMLRRTARSAGVLKTYSLGSRRPASLVCQASAKNLVARFSRTERTSRVHLPYFPAMHAAHFSTPSNTAAEDEPQAGQTQSKEEQALVRLEAFHDAMHGMAPGDAAGCLRISYAIIYEIITYVARHGDDSAAAYLSVFMNSEAPANSNIGRARKSVFRLARLVVSVLSSVPASSPLWTRNPQIFALLGALEPAFMVYDGPDAGDTQQWTQFWDRTQPILLELGNQLDQAGFGAE